jgi:hypothetical protein
MDGVLSRQASKQPKSQRNDPGVRSHDPKLQWLVEGVAAMVCTAATHVP